MKYLTLGLLAMASFSSLLVTSIASAKACTPHPDDPSGCDNWPPRQVVVQELKLRKPWPGPVCLSCPTNLKVQDHLILKGNILQPAIPQETLPQVNENLGAIQGIR